MLYRLNNKCLDHIPGNMTGIYKIYARTRNNVPIQIPRLAGNDTHGLLYIEGTPQQTLRNKIYQFYTTLHTDAVVSEYNTAALKYKMHQVIQKALGEDHMLFFEFQVCENPVVAEQEQLEAYAHEFGEYPPLNK